MMDNCLLNVSTLSKESLLRLIEKTYLCAFGSKSFYETVFGRPDILLLLPENLQKILEVTVNNFRAKKYPPPLSFRKFFLKILLKEVESSEYEATEELLFAYADTLTEASTNDSLWFYSYFITETEVLTIQENPNLVVNSTTGLRTWEAAKYLTEWCIGNAHLFRNRHILELGSGTGLVGIALCKLAEPSIFTFTDKSPDVLRLISSNLQLNELSANTSDFLHCSEVASNENISPCESCTNELNSHSLCNINICHLQWENITDQHALTWSPDIILAADVVFDPSTVPHLIHVIHTFLNNGAQCAYIASTVRNSDTYSCFLNSLDSFSLKKQDLAGPEKLELFYETIPSLKICKIQMT